MIHPWLNGAILTISLANTILLLWLGLTVLLNAERRTAGLYAAGGALLLGGLFFLSHTAIVHFANALRLEDIELWWRAGWIPVTCLPFAWYGVTLWYGGYWERDSTLRRRHRAWLYLAAFLAVSLLLLLTFAHSLPSAAQLVTLDLTSAASPLGVPLLILFYPFYAVLCTGLSLDVLRAPAPSRHAIEEQARRRAWPWLGATSLGLFAVSLLVGGAVFWAIASAGQLTFDDQMVNVIGLLDLVISALITFSIVMVGQAIVNYEVFTGKSLPRRGLQRYWRRAMVWSLLYSLAAAVTIVLALPSIYVLLLTTLLLGGFYAMISRRSFDERERLMDSLRPFLAGHELYGELLANPSQALAGSGAATGVGSAVAIQPAFEALCREVLETSLAYLIPLGSLAPLAGPGLAYPPGAVLPGLGAAALQVEGDQAGGWLAVDPQRHGGARWAVLLSGRGAPAGVLLLGEKRSGSLYTQEEIDVARLAGESLLERQAGAELASRLMALQRQRLVESQVLDQQARRVLHDEILPQLHEAILLLSGGDADGAVAEMSQAHTRIAGLLRKLPPPANPQISELGLAGALRTLVEEEYRSHFDQVDVEIEPEAARRLDALPGLAAQVAYFAAREAVRNAARYGRGERLERALRLALAASAGEQGLSITVEDDGVGLPALLEPGPHRSSDGAGQGLALHSTLLAVLGGTLAVETPAGVGTRVRIWLPELPRTSTT